MTKNKPNPREKVLIDPGTLRDRRLASEHSTIEALAKKAQLSRSYISMLETGKYEQVPWATAKKIADALGLLTPSELSGSGSPKSEARQPPRPATRLGFLRRLEEIERRLEEMTAGQYYTLGEVFRVEKKWDDSVWQFEQTIQRDRNYTPAYLGLAECLLDRARSSPNEKIDRLLSGALENCNIAIGQNLRFESGDESDRKKAAPTYLIRAKIRDSLERLEDAKMDIEKAKAVWPGIERFIKREDFPNLNKAGRFDELGSRETAEEINNAAG